MGHRFSSHIAVGVFVVAIGLSARATPANKAAVGRYFDRFLSRNLQSCNLCHLPTEKGDPDTLEEIPHNAFGAALRKVGKELKAAGKKRDIGIRVEMIGGQDSDGDGVDNLSEILLGHNPGDAKDRPTEKELAGLAERKEAFAVYLKSYKWEPFEPVVRPAVPTIKNAAWVRNPIDAFVEEQREQRGLTASAEAPRAVLLRRVYLDLIGLNPTPAAIAAFEADRSANAYEKVVDRLLADPRYGQRWARHWMDIWRYSDWAGWSGGNQIRDSQPFIWRWRDWIVESLNADKGYDRMVLEMLAGDELCPTDPSALRATGFLVRNYKMLSREQWLEDTVNHTSRAFLGLTMHCAKCHDHKFDPISQAEYYEMRAIFEPHNVRTDPVPGVGDKKRDGLVRAYDKDLATPTMLYLRGDERTPDKARGPVSPGVPAVLGGELEIKPINLPAEAAHPDRVDFMRKALLAEEAAALEAARKKYAPMRDDNKLPARKRSEAEAALGLAKARLDALTKQLHAEELEDAGKKGSADWKVAATEALGAQRRLAAARAGSDLIAAQNAADDAREKGDAGTAAVKAAQGKIEAAQKALAKAVNELGEPEGTSYKSRSTDDYPQTSTGRRLAFARWLIDRQNPLTARVAVNHIWARHFGQGLVPSVDDFGRNGRAATHPALVDWLASALMDSNWEMKGIHRLIVTSATYRQSSVAREEELARDPDDTYLWRMPSKRMEAELVRDNVLWVSGQLDLTAGGPEIDQGLGLTNHRRSLYFRSAPEKEVEFLRIFDGPSVTECYFRRPSVIPQQALALGNSQLVVEQAHVLAGQLAAVADDGAFVRAAFLRVLARHATDEEVSACVGYLGEDGSTAGRKREELIGVLFNHNDFVTVR